MLTTLPEWQPLTPESASLRLESERVPGGLAGRVALAYVGWEGGEEWVAGFAVSLARNCSEKLPACLIDASIEAGVLDGIARGLGRTEGVTDAVLFGASSQYVTHDLGGSLSFVPAGTPGADPAEVLQSPTWSRLWTQSAQPGLGLVLVPIGHPGTDRILEDAEAIIVARPQDARPVLPEAIVRKTVAVVGPPVESIAADEESTAVDEAAPSETETAVEAPVAAAESTAAAVNAEPETDGVDTAQAPEDAAMDPWGQPDGGEEPEPAMGGVDLSAPVDIDLDDIDELDVLEEAASADVTEEWLEPSPVAEAPGGSDVWSELGSSFSLRESFNEAEGPGEESALDAEEDVPAPTSGAGVSGLVNPEIDELIKPSSQGPPPLDGEPRAEETASSPAEVEEPEPAPSIEALQALAQRTQRTAPAPRELPIRRVVLLIVLMALLFAIWMGWIPVPFTS